VNSLKLTHFLLGHRPDFFSLDVDSQGSARLTIASENRAALDAYIEKIVDREILDKGLEDNQFVRAELYGYYLCLAAGLGENRILLNDEIDMLTVMSELNLLENYDFREFLFKRDAGQQDAGVDKPRPLGIQSVFFSYINKDSYRTAELTSLSHYICKKVRANAVKIINKAIPNKKETLFTHRSSNSENDDFSMRLARVTSIDAGGKESELANAKSLTKKYFEQLKVALDDRLHDEAPVYYEIHDGENHTEFVFSNVKSIEGVRFSNLISDIEGKTKGHRFVVDALIADETEQFKKFILQKIN
jgi:hypothetical protein